MTPRLVIAFSLLLILVPGMVGAAEHSEQACPIEPFNLTAVENVIKRARSCDAAMALFNRCGSGASGDLHTGDIVIKKCEAAFAGRLSVPQRRAYSRARHICATKYADESGTMYRSFEAYCFPQAAHRMARQATKATMGTPKQ